MPTDNVPVLSVSELSFALKRTVEDAFGLVRVRGEISNCRGPAASGHLYFAVKDEHAVLDAVAWRSTVQRLAFRPEDGLEVVCTGRLTTYPGRSRYQIVVERMEPAGVGALMALLEERRRKLAAEGLFDASRKRPLPYLPEVIAVVTSPTGAVIRDILHRLQDRFPRRVIVVPVAVQGEAAAEQVAKALATLDALPADGPVPRPDVILVARGGGSLEDLWAFNEEEVVRAVAACSIPVVSAVGHETDTTLIDLVADRRAPTPTAAAEIAVPVRADLIAQIAGLQGRIEAAVHRRRQELATHLGRAARGLPDPRSLLALPQQRVDDLGERLRLRRPIDVVRARIDLLIARGRRIDELVRDRLATAELGLSTTGPRLARRHVASRIAAGERELAVRARRLTPLALRQLGDLGRRLDGQAQLLESLGWRRVLERGYAVVRRVADRRLVGTAAAARNATTLDLVFADGEVRVLREPERRQRARPEPELPQESLL